MRLFQDTGFSARDIALQSIMYIMLGSVIGYLFFYDMFYYYCAPFNSSLPAWLMVILLCLIGVLACYLNPDIVHLMISVTVLPLLGAFFCYILYICPVFSPDIISAGFSDGVFFVIHYILFDMILAFVVIFASGFLSLYLFDS